MAVVIRTFTHAIIIAALATLASMLLFALALVVSKGVKAEPYVAGDSICVGMAQAARLPSVARVGAHTREVPAQLRKIPKGTKVYLCTGANDAAALLDGFRPAVGLVLAEAKHRNQRLIWIGPMRSRLWWDVWSDRADTFLALAVPNYVSLRAIGWKRHELAPDGIHLTPAGYRRLAQIVRGKWQH